MLEYLGPKNDGVYNSFKCFIKNVCIHMQTQRDGKILRMNLGKECMCVHCSVLTI